MPYMTQKTPGLGHSAPVPIHQASASAIHSRYQSGAQNGMATGGNVYSTSYNGKQNGFQYGFTPSAAPNGIMNGYHGPLQNGGATSRRSSSQGGVFAGAFAGSLESLRLGSPPPTEYNESVEELREMEYPNMKDGAYLDHGGATIYAKSLIEDFSQAMISTLYGNPHSENTPARVAGEMVDRTREKTLRFLGADPEHFDLVFVANATAGIKLVADSFRDLAEKTPTGTFWYGYHKEAHTSLVGVREFAGGDAHAFGSDHEVESWLHDPWGAGVHRAASPAGLGLFAYPGQSNLTGRRMPRAWVRRLRENRELRNTYSLFDAAALAMTCPLNKLFEDPASAPDFTCLSFYKIFGFPDLGGLVIRKSSGHILNSCRKYFGGGTISWIEVVGKGPSAPAGHRTRGSDDRYTVSSIHDGLEDGTVPFHSILALDIAIDTHIRLYGSMEVIARHTQHLARTLYEGMSGMRHGNGRPVVEICADDHPDGGAAFGDGRRQGPTVAFSVIRADGSFVPWTEVEKLANDQNVYIRAGGVCCPGGVYTALKYESWEWERMYSAGHMCGSTTLALVHEKPTGLARASLGAMSTRADVASFLTFLHSTFVEPLSVVQSLQSIAITESQDNSTSEIPHAVSTPSASTSNVSSYGISVGHAPQPGRYQPQIPHPIPLPQQNQIQRQQTNQTNGAPHVSPVQPGRTWIGSREPSLDNPYIEPPFFDHTPIIASASTRDDAAMQNYEVNEVNIEVPGSRKPTTLRTGGFLKRFHRMSQDPLHGKNASALKT